MTSLALKLNRVGCLSSVESVKVAIVNWALHAHPGTRKQVLCVSFNQKNRCALALAVAASWSAPCVFFSVNDF